MAERVAMSEVQRRNRVVLLMATLIFPGFALTDYLLAPQVFGWTLSLRLLYSGAALGLFLAVPRLAERRQPVVLAAAYWGASLAQCGVMLLNRDLSACVNLGMVPVVISMFIPLRRREALLLHGVAFAVLFVVPFALIFPGYANRTVALAGMLAGVAALGLAILNHAVSARERRAEEGALAELDRSTQERSAGLAQERARMGQLSGALGEVSRVLAALDASAAALESEAGGLSATAERINESAREAVEGGGSARRAVGAMADALAAGRERVEAYGQHERQEAAAARGRLVDGALEVAGAVAEIGDTARQVAEIAKETRLLALNTGVAAARENGAGGLYVISSGMRELSDQVEGHATQMRARVLEVVRAARRLDEGVEGHAGVAALGAQELEATLEAARHVSGSIARIRQAVAALAGVSAEQAEAAAAIAGSAKALAASAAELRRTAAELREKADQLWVDAAQAA